MTADSIIFLGRETLTTAMVLAAPILVVGLVIGLVVAVFQAVTSVQEQSLSMIPKMLGVGIALIVLMPWMVDRILVFTGGAFERIAVMAR